MKCYSSSHSIARSIVTDSPVMQGKEMAKKQREEERGDGIKQMDSRKRMRKK